MTIPVQPVVLSGGAGTRLWPFSREAYPKQFLSLTGDKSLFQQTVDRVLSTDPEDGHLEFLSPLIVCNEIHRFIVAEQLRLLGVEGSGILLEPVGKNTAPAVTLAALHAQESGRDPVLAVLPSDHHVEDVAEFQARMSKAVEMAAKGDIVTFGIVAESPETGFGYIRRGPEIEDGVYVLDGFTEKPDAKTAAEYLASERYYWNSGIFVMRVGTWLEQIARHQPAIFDACKAALAASKRDGDFIRIDKEAFAKCPSDSIDYAVMEKLTSGSQEGPRGAVLPLDVGWSDLGSWPALSKVRPRDGDGNVTIGDVFLKDTQNSLLYSQSRFVAAVGLADVVVIETTDAVLVAHKDRAQDVKTITEHLKKANRSEHIFHTKVHRPWGDYESIDNGQRYQVKRLTIKPGATLSLQLHHHRAEHWIVVKGTARVTRGEETFLLTENESTYIPLGVKHRLENPGTIPLEIIEVQSGSYLGEDDIVRFEDRYHRLESP
ncbi:mannose-1-phosphate guanylyltransferase/mannose-6-phosphate isomerase [Methylocaldum szegediense]|jgi:mannose-1-phosphate guanylyltransferase/mannose-6-phosphate isomerase|uniref:mannose-1-phosphate guanylyltransferase n=1 Tax=Methylocaldum szegediense TaxID=73780 RepID=A0ABN8X150_9GAMM|nr:mannose-1-phosphate guanylyltransferase/mannose-6-phosphate isomerase [Methylocaldum szegediense]CAI8755298.1 mannose-1-phosphate guanylyltransferase [Methylocaldum szegediense]